MEVAYLVGEHAVFVSQEAETPLLLQQRLPTAIGDELLHVHLARRDGGHVLHEDNTVADLCEINEHMKIVSDTMLRFLPI